jgi:hypothetical protein
MGKMITNIVFTRDRPLQLEAHLTSLYRCLPKEIIQTYIVYKPDLFNEQYTELFRRFCGCIVIREHDFHDDFIGLIGQLDTKYVLFGTDDVVYFDSMDFGVINEVFDRFGKEIFGFSLRLDIANLRQERSHLQHGPGERCCRACGQRPSAAKTVVSRRLSTY